MNNCHTCKHNVYQAMRVDENPEDGMTNVCQQPDQTDALQDWIDEQAWDDDAMCPKVTTPCPGFKART